MHKFGTNMWYPAIVPGCVHTDLINNKVIPDPFHRDNEKKLQWIDKCSWEYATEFKVDKRFTGKQNAEIVFKGLDTYADVYLNEQLIIKADNMFVEWKADVKPFLHEGSNSLRILFHSPIVMGLLLKDQWNIEAPIGYNMDFGQSLGSLVSSTSDFPPVGPYTRKAAYMYGWDWAPTLTTSGIWRPVYLEAWDNARISSVQILQNDLSKSKADLTVNLLINSAQDQNLSFTTSWRTTGISKSIKSENIKLVKGENVVPLAISIDNPELWWPNGMGKHPVYNFTFSLLNGNNLIDSCSQKTGLRKVRLVQEKDSFGTSFYFEINGVPVFAKGANYVPTDIFPSRTTLDHYKVLLKSAAEANINMLRVWGGGIYESDLFYNLCDEVGIMIWQDFAFSIAQLPDNEPFLQSIRQEVSDNIIRLRNHPSIVLWCGNNETELIWDIFEKGLFGFQANTAALPTLSTLMKLLPKAPVKQETTDRVINSYSEIFYKLIPDAIKKYDNDSRPYWPSSPCGGWKIPFNSNSGDMHYYVAYVNAPFEAYYSLKSRFYSEHGFQSFPDFNVVKSFTTTEDRNILSPIMQHHQRAMGGNQVLDKYMKMYYRYPKDFESYLYVSQVMQAQVMKMAFETHRRSRPLTMGSLYWQLNDVWPVASWSSLDYLNHWKALHYQVKRSFSNVILAPVAYKNKFDLYMVSDSLKPVKGWVDIRITDFNGKELKKMTYPSGIDANTSRLLLSKPESELLGTIDSTKAFCTVRFISRGKVLTENNCFFTAFRNLDLPKVNISKKISPGKDGFIIEITADKFAKSVYLSTDNEGFFSDNYFDLQPGEVKVITFKTAGKSDNFDKNLKIVSLVDSY